jgi:Bacterial Ig-like domain
VLAVNNAPAGTDNTITTLEDTGHTFAASDFGFTDPNDSPANNLLAVEITTLPTAGTLKDNGVAVTAGQFVSVTDINAGDLVFTPAPNVNGNGYAHFTFQVEDDGGTANGGVNLDPTPNTITFNVTPVNDAPVASGTAALALPNTVAALFTSHFDDSADNQPALPGGSTANTLAGIAITGDTANATTQGSWEYSTDGGTSWIDIVAGSVSATSALVLSSTAELRFAAAAGFSGAPGGLTAHVIDNSTGNVSTTGATGAALQGSSSSFTGIDIASHDGGSTPISTGTASLTVVVPSVVSIDRAGSTPSNAGSDSFTVTFSAGVTGVDSSDFTVVTGNTVADTGISVTADSASVYTVTVNGVTGDGTLGLNLNASGTGIADASSGTAISGGLIGQVYTVDHTAPTVSSIVPTGANPNNGGTEQFTVSFSESVTGVDTSDFTVATSGTSDTGISSISGSGSTYILTVVGVGGNGTLGVDLKNSGTGIDDLVGNPISGGFTGSPYTIDTVAPTVSSITALGSSPNNAGSDQFLVVFSKSVSGVVRATLR